MRTWWLLAIAAGCGKNADPPAPTAAPTKVAIVADARVADAVADAWSLDQIDRHTDAVYEGDIPIPTPGLTDPVAPREIAGTLLLDGALVDITRLDPKVVLSSCGNIEDNGAIVTLSVGGGKSVVEIDINSPYLKVDHKLALWRDDARHQHHGAVPATVFAYTTDAAGKQIRDEATKGTLVAHELHPQLDLELDAWFGDHGHLTGRFVITPAADHGRCRID